MMNICNLLKNNPGVLELLKKPKTFATHSIIQEALMIASAFFVSNERMVIVKHNAYQALQLYETLLSLNVNALLYTTEESLRVESIAYTPESRGNKVAVMAALLKPQKVILVTHTGALLRYLPIPEVFEERTFELKVNQEIDMNALCQKLVENGYEQVSHVEAPLTFSRRGGIIDFYGMNHDQPIRIEFFGDEIENIYTFDVETQRREKAISYVTCIPASDILFTKEMLEEVKEGVEKQLADISNEQLEKLVQADLVNLYDFQHNSNYYHYYAYVKCVSSILDYVKDAFVITESLHKMEDTAQRILNELTLYIQEMVEENKILPNFSLMHEIRRILPKKYTVLDDYGDNISHIQKIDVPDGTISYKLNYLLKEAQTVVLLLEDKTLAQVIETCVNENIVYQLMDEQNTLEKGLNIGLGYLKEGFFAMQESLIVVGVNDFFHQKKEIRRYDSKFRQAEILSQYQDLQPYDYVVHSTYGIGQYLGIENKEVQNIKKDYLKIIYKDNAEVLVPLEQFKLVRKFVSKDGIVPKLNKIGSSEWEKTKSRIKNNVKDIAKQLMQLYQERTSHIGFAFNKDNDEQIAFENQFEHPLTRDQEIAIEEIKKDMESDIPMDRLLIGDVGFGKTEVAMRVAFKAVLSGKQVAFLCPTTILSNQHYATFLHRFKDFNVNVAVVNRFITPVQLKQIMDDLLEGNIHILIGTHRLLSKDVLFNDLGLLIIDEEQRFGVEHKEKIKVLKNTIDVLSLSATPIPRTLQMSLIGIRGMSTLNHPPHNRYPVMTSIVVKSDALIKEVIEKELSRGGQIFYLYNKVEDIYHVARKIEKLVPDGKIQVVHGQMSKLEIEEAMMRFTFNEYNILVCTTIIETGIDISNANTILVEDANRFGLSQLYQIRGRVGRSNRVAYAYLMIQDHQQLSEISEKRLKAIKEFTSLGSGYKIAMRDIAIRGAGDLLGPQQSGFIDTVGIDMYIEMLAEAIQEEKGEVISKEEEKVPNIMVNGYLPESFTNNDYEKLTLYQDIDKIQTLEELDTLLNQVTDTYGRLPKAVQELFAKRKLVIYSRFDYVEDIIQNNNEIEVIFTKTFSDTIDGVALFQGLSKLSKDLFLSYRENKIRVTLKPFNQRLVLIFKVIEDVKEYVNEN